MLWILLTFALSSLSFAQTRVCQLDPLDIFEPQGQMPSGPFMGQCLRTEGRRSFYLPPPGQTESYGITTTGTRSVVIANISHNSQFHLGEVPVDQISRVVFQIERFDPKWIAAHTQLRFDFKSPVLLTPQRPGSIDPQPQKVSVSSLVFSVEALPMRDGPNYDLFLGRKGYYGLAYRMTSLEQKIQDVVIGEKNPVDQFQLNLSSQGSKALFEFILANYNKKEITELYHTVDRNCTNVLFEIFDQMADKDRWILNRALRALPILSPGLLYQRGLTDLHENTYEPNMPSLAEEFGIRIETSQPLAP